MPTSFWVCSPTDEPEHFAPVGFNDDDKVISTVDKPAHAEFNNTWSIAVSTEAFWSFLKEQSKDLEPGISITQTFDEAAKSELKVYCEFF